MPGTGNTTPAILDEPRSNPACDWTYFDAALEYAGVPATRHAEAKRMLSRLDANSGA